MLAAAKRVEAAESAAAALQKELAAMAPRPDPSSTLALPSASNLELRVYESLGLDAAIGDGVEQVAARNGRTSAATALRAIAEEDACRVADQRTAAEAAL